MGKKFRPILKSAALRKFPGLDCYSLILASISHNRPITTIDRYYKDAESDETIHSLETGALGQKCINKLAQALDKYRTDKEV